MTYIEKAQECRISHAHEYFFGGQLGSLVGLIQAQPDLYRAVFGISAAVVVWRVVDTAEAIFEVDDYEDFVRIQSEAAIRNLATGYPYDQNEAGGYALRSHSKEIAEELRKEIQARLVSAGVEAIEARISHLAYAAEIASAMMLRRQQADAVIAARSKIVEGAVGMVEMALNKLSEKKIVKLDDERKASMVSNLLVVLYSESETHPVINAGSLYS